MSPSRAIAALALAAAGWAAEPEAAADSQPPVEVAAAPAPQAPVGAARPAETPPPLDPARFCAAVWQDAGVAPEPFGPAWADEEGNVHCWSAREPIRE